MFPSDVAVNTGEGDRYHWRTSGGTDIQRRSDRLELCSLASTPCASVWCGSFDHPNYIFELKHDGFRAIAFLQNGESKLISRNQRNLGFEALKRALAKLPVENAILDGEVRAGTNF